MTTIDYPFTQDQFEAAARSWGCNCGPSALAFACQISLDEARRSILGFDQKHYTSPSMMRAALASLRRTFLSVVPPAPAVLCRERPALVRVQWTGPWTAPGANPRWAYWHTHWIAAWRVVKTSPQHGLRIFDQVFDCNAGVVMLDEWISTVVPMLATAPRADGGWYPTHVWRLGEGARP